MAAIASPKVGMRFTAKKAMRRRENAIELSIMETQINPKLTISPDKWRVARSNVAFTFPVRLLLLSL